jgi:methionyl aminopeptidase
VVPASPYEWPEALNACEPGTLLAVEPMIAVGTGQVQQRGREWPIFTADGSLAVHYEHDVLVTEEGPRVLTTGLEELPDIVG